MALRRWEINPTKIQMGRKIGSGAFGSVFEANIEGDFKSPLRLLKSNGPNSSTKVAVKMLKG